MGLVNEGEKGQPVYGIFISPILQDVGYFGRSKAEQLFDLVVQIHKQGYLHRDIRPDNVKLNQLTNQVYLIDFGFAIKKGTFFFLFFFLKVLSPRNLLPQDLIISKKSLLKLMLVP